MVAELRHRKMARTPAHGSHRAHGAVIDSGDRASQQSPNQDAVVPPGRQGGLTSSEKAKAIVAGAQDTYECDVLVAGSGCAGMSAAVTAGHHGLNVLIVEKEPRFGGTTARSLGGARLGRALLFSEGVLE